MRELLNRLKVLVVTVVVSFVLRVLYRRRVKQREASTMPDFGTKLLYCKKDERMSRAYFITNRFFQSFTFLNIFEIFIVAMQVF